MHSALRVAMDAAFSLSLAASGAAQAFHEHAGAHEEALGRVVFPTSCNAAAQAQFVRGVTLLHSFWYDRAEEVFRAAATADTTCAMAYWGQAMSLLHPLWTPPGAADLAAGQAAAARGAALASTPRERDYLGAIATYYTGYATAEPDARLAAYAMAMERVARRNPSDWEAQIFYGLALIAVGLAHPTDTTFRYQKQADAILEPLFRLEPNHPGLAHYLIHTNDVPQLARLGLYAARRYAAIAPDAPHAQHMPSHIFTRLGLWDDDIAANTRSAAAAEQVEGARHLNALWDQRGHAWDYLVYAYLQEGRDREAQRIAETAAGVTAGYPAGSLTNEYALAAIPARCALERGRWGAAARLTVRPAPEWLASEAITHYARALGAARSGDTSAARAELAALATIEGAEATAGGPHAYWSGQVKIQRLAAGAWLAAAAGDSIGAIREATAAADLEDGTQKHPVTPGAVLPARELLGDLLLELRRPRAAAKAYAASLAGQPNRARSLFGAARAAELAGDTATARVRYGEFVNLVAKGDRDRPELEQARRFLASR